MTRGNEQTAFDVTSRDVALNTKKGMATPHEIADLCEIEAELGHGNQGKVYLGIRKSDGLKMAVKQLRIDSVSTWKDYELFQREAEVLMSLNMDGVARCYGVRECLDVEPPAVYLFQEFIPGGTLEAMIASGHRFSQKAIFEIALQIIGILKKLHAHTPPVIHRDLKPSNIMVNQRGVDSYDVTIIDFGAVANPQIQSGGSTIAGTYGYMPPEQLMGKPEPASDFYALAALVVQLLSGVEPINMPVADFHPVIEPYLEDQPDCVVGILRKMLEPNPMERLADADILIPIFENFARGQFPPSSINAAYDKKTYDQKLRAVAFLGQGGNISLWQQLPEKTPRDIPDAYKKMHIQDRFSKQGLVKLSKDEAKYMLEPDRVLGGIFFMGWTVMIIVIYLINIATNEYSEIKVLESIMSVIFFLIPSVVIFFWIYKTSDTSKKRNKISLKNIQKNAKQLDSSLIQILLKHGRKTVAIIKSIAYESADLQYIETFMTDKNESYFYNHGIATFVVEYQFNPPDDADPEPLVHQIKIHFSPEGKIKPGDPLPILYYIDPDDAAYVISMPFPYPLADIVSFKDICYRSFSRPDEQQQEQTVS